MVVTSPIYSVLVTGAAGKTGQIVYKKLKERSDRFTTIRGLVQTEESKQLIGGGDDVFIGDIRQPDSILPAIRGIDAIIILTSSTPKVLPGPNSIISSFGFEPGASPEEVDYNGQKNQLDLAKSEGLKRVVLVVPMGAVYEEHPLNGLANAHMLMWKKRVEQYLDNMSLPFTIIRPGCMLDHKPGGVRELIHGGYDELLETPTRTIPRADVAEVCVQALMYEEARYKAFDLVSKPEGVGTPTTDFKYFFNNITYVF